MRCDPRLQPQHVLTQPASDTIAGRDEFKQRAEAAELSQGNGGGALTTWPGGVRTYLLAKAGLKVGEDYSESETPQKK